MAGSYLLGVDIGTGGTKAGLFSESGECVAEAFEESFLSRPEPGTVTEDPERQTASVARTIAACVQRAGVNRSSVCGIAIDGQMAGVLGIGPDGRNVTPYDSWLDTRCSHYIEQMTGVAGDAVLASTGNTPSFNHGPKILWWMHEHPDIYKRVRAFVQPGGYAAMRLCGLGADAAYIDTSYLHFSGFADAAHARWNRDLVDTFNVDADKLPRICNPQEVVGALDAEAASQCGLLEGTPVAAGCGDTAASFLSCGAVEEGICVDVAGTASVFAATVNQFRVDKADRIMGIGRSVVPGLWHPYAYINGGGLNLSWFRDQVVRESIRLTGSSATVDLDQLGELASTVPLDAASPIFVPHLSGRVTPAAPALRGAWVGLDWSHGLGELYRSLLEGVALEYGVYLKTIRRIFPDIRLQEVRVTGGGEKSALWNRIKSDVAGLPLVSIVGSRGAPMGTALLAGFACGLFANVAEAAGRWVRLGNRTEPDSAAAALYAGRLDRYEHLLRVLDEFSSNRGAQS